VHDDMAFFRREGVFWVSKLGEIRCLGWKKSCDTKKGKYIVYMRGNDVYDV